MCFLFMMCHMTVRRPNLEDVSQSHGINTVVALVSCCAWKCAPRAISGGINLLRLMSSQQRSQKLLSG